MSRKWSVVEHALHINLLELSVVEYAIQRQRQIQTYLIVDSTVIQLIIQQWSPTSIAREKKFAAMRVMTWMILH